MDSSLKKEITENIDEHTISIKELEAYVFEERPQEKKK